VNNCGHKNVYSAVPRNVVFVLVEEEEEKKKTNIKQKSLITSGPLDKTAYVCHVVLSHLARSDPLILGLRVKWPTAMLPGDSYI
jgi:hypothetical protein